MTPQKHCSKLFSVTVSKERGFRCEWAALGGSDASPSFNECNSLAIGYGSANWITIRTLRPTKIYIKMQWMWIRRKNNCWFQRAPSTFFRNIISFPWTWFKIRNINGTFMNMDDFVILNFNCVIKLIAI